MNKGIKILIGILVIIIVIIVGYWILEERGIYIFSKR